MEYLLVFFHSYFAKNDLWIAVSCWTELERVHAVHDAGVFVWDYDSNEITYLYYLDSLEADHFISVGSDIELEQG